jgi:peroxiredoxin
MRAHGIQEKGGTLALLASTLTLSAGAFTARAEPPRIGAMAPLFTLPAADGAKEVALKDLLAKNKAVALIFIATQCPFSNAYNERMAGLASQYAGKAIAVIGINSNATEPAAEVVKHARSHGLAFPILKDEKNRVADLFDARRTPEVFLVDSTGVLVYHGRIDESSDDPKNVRSPDLRNALDALLAGKGVPVAETKAFGCSIKRS